MDLQYIMRERIIYFFKENYLKRLAILKFFFLKPKLKKEKYYHLINKKELHRLKKSDTVVIFGSGYSINEITKEEIKKLEKFDTLTFNYFFKCNKVRIDYHIIREVGRDDKIEDYIKEIKENEKYNNTTFLVCGNIIHGHTMLKNKMLRKKANIFIFKNKHLKSLIKKTVGKNFNNVSHNHGTLEEAVNLAYLMKYKNIILAGVDLYDSRYFWLEKNETRNTDIRMKRTYEDKWGNTGPIMKLFQSWIPAFKKKGVRMYVLNPKSLMNRIMPVWKFKKN